MRNRNNTPMELYVHIPFCVKKCDYCDFLSGPADQETKKAYVQALLAEIKAVSGFQNREISSVFIGGGTPSALSASDIGRIMKTLGETFHFSEKAEITIEANPGTLTREKLEVYQKSGINRLSLGLQSADNRELKSLGRIHTFEEFLENYYLARKVGFDNINVDLMSAIPGQSCEGWIRNLRTVAELKPEHISAYSLIIEDGTPFAEQELDLPDEESEYRMYEDTAKILQEYGFYQYEISNYAKVGYECRHNIGYWKRAEYLGLGLGASSLVSGSGGDDAEYRFNNTRDIREYLQNSSEPDKIRREIEHLSDKEEQEEFMFLGLRMTGGISEKEFQNCFGKSLDSVYGKVLKKYSAMGFLEKNGSYWYFTRQGIHVSNQILADFLQD